MFVIHYSKAHEVAERVGEFDTFAQAVTAACRAGAVGEPQQTGDNGWVFDVDGHEDDDDYGIWIDRVADCCPARAGLAVSG